jgi:branched-subunit amino acid transport protein AzlD
MSTFHIAFIIFIAGAITCFTRTFPFLLFKNKKEAPPSFKYFELNIPPVILLLLVVYCLKNVAWLKPPYGLPELVSISAVVTVHLLKRNALLSIFTGTALYVYLVN